MRELDIRFLWNHVGTSDAVDGNVSRRARECECVGRLLGYAFNNICRVAFDLGLVN
jgi:hypothetical protein